MDSKRFASPIMGIICGGLNDSCMQTQPLFLRTSGSSGVLKALLLDNDKAMVVYLLMALLLVLSLVHKTGFDLFDINAEHMHSLNIAFLGVHFGTTLWLSCCEVLPFCMLLY